MSVSTRHMLTTIDNPFNPWTQWNEWFAFDTTSGYNSCGLLARIARVSEDLSVTDQTLRIEKAIDEIVTENVSGFHTKVAAP